MHGFGLVRYGSTPVSSYIFFPQRLPTLYPQILDSPVFLQKNILLSDWTAVVCLQYRKIGNLSVIQPVYWHFDVNVCGQSISSTKERENA